MEELKQIWIKAQKEWEELRWLYLKEKIDDIPNQSDYILGKVYEAGYRKQSENTVEVVRCKECQNCEKVPSILGTVLYCNEWCKDVDEDTFCSFGAKMKGGAE